MYEPNSFDLAFYSQAPDSSIILAFTNKAKQTLEHRFPHLRWRHERWYLTCVALEDLEAIAEAAEDAGLWVAVIAIGETFH